MTEPKNEFQELRAMLVKHGELEACLESLKDDGTARVEIELTAQNYIVVAFRLAHHITPQ